MLKLFLVNTVLIKIVFGEVDCDTEANSASDCFSLGCCYNGVNGCGDCNTLCTGFVGDEEIPCSSYGCCPTSVNGNVIGTQCQSSLSVITSGPICCIADEGSCSAASIATGLCCECEIDGSTTCGLQYQISDLRFTTLSCDDSCITESPTNTPSSNPSKFDCLYLFTETSCKQYSDECCYCEESQYFESFGCESACCVPEPSECCQTNTPTKKPTGNPTAKPTAKPTSAPTSNPTSKPTGNPIAEPTSNPTDKPTGNPTTKSTNNPISEPTAKPTTSTTTTTTTTTTTSKFPTSQPTRRPTSKSAEKWQGIHPDYKGKYGELLWQIYYGEFKDDPRFDELRKSNAWAVEDYLNSSELPEFHVNKNIKTVKTAGNTQYTWLKLVGIIMIIIFLLYCCGGFNYIKDWFNKSNTINATTKLLNNIEKKPLITRDGYEQI